MTNQSNLFFYFLFVILICVSNGSIKVFNNGESVESLGKTFDLEDDLFNSSSLKDVMLMDSQDCDCGPNATECFRMNDQGQECKCKKGYAPKLKGKDEFCEECDCGIFGLACEFDKKTGKQNCTCREGYGPKYLNLTTGEQKCEECDCGKNTKRCLKTPDDKKYCWCQLGNFTDFFVTTTKELCKVCDCGPHSVSCDFSSNLKQFCQCKPGYYSKQTEIRTDGESCELCDCGYNGKCNVKVVGNRSVKECICNPGYKEYKGECKKCDCGLNSHNCTFYEHNGNQMCDCKKGYTTKETFTWKDEYCERCDCGEFGESCSFLFKYRRCTCKEGYTSDIGILEDDGKCEKPWLRGGIIALIVVGVILIVVVAAAAIIRFIFMSSRR